eukprot:CAMPEP_0181249016 /NCGR_PEP_ID=MMETSP1096-20121128/45510_1 /TAXON_ID=156174 ORGANISM="Chrysochromulina ericina, Strain CCMP281" /NCGR_SAMPLE_ID=MMETSP1096 /ASSEMBLY_ACC=CAM_ASM_000453 /LENGTH=85 /DNA_ID=CAMNT_0023346287 /DNA_START=352 /DNA_END=609 /DNA_ORIENTATION=+
MRPLPMQHIIAHGRLVQAQRAGAKQPPHAGRTDRARRGDTCFGPVAARSPKQLSQSVATASAPPPRTQPCMSASSLDVLFRSLAT